MIDSIQAGTVFIEAGAVLPESLHLESVPGRERVEAARKRRPSSL